MKIKIETISLSIISLLIMKNILIYSLYFPLPKLVENSIEILGFGYLILICVTKYIKNKKGLMLVAILSVCTIYTGIKTNQMVLFSSMLAIFLSQTITDKEKIVKVIFYTMFSILLIHFAIFILNNDFQLITDRTIRYNLGFKHPNVGGAFVLWCFCAYSYINRHNIRKILKALLFVILIYFINKTRTMLQCAILLYLLLILSKNDKCRKIISFFSKYIYIIISLSFFSILLLYDNGYFIDIISNLDKLFSYRISFSLLAIKTYGFTLFGQGIQDIILPNLFVSNINLGALTIDVTYIGFLYNFGIIYYLLLLVLTYKISKKGCIHKRILLIIWCVFALFEQSSLNFIICFPFLLMDDKREEVQNDT